MKVLQISKLYYPWIGGVEKVVQDIAEGLKDKLSISVLVCQPSGKGKGELINGVPVYRAGSVGTYLSMPISLSFPFLLRKLGKDKDILHFHTPFPLGVISYLLTKPKGKLVVWWHSDIVRQKNIMPVYKPFLLQFLKKADRIIVATAEHIENSSFLKAFKNKCEIIPFGIDIKQFQLNSNIQREVAKIREKHGAKIVLFVGRLIYYKGVEYLIKAVNIVKMTGEYRHLKLLIVGDSLNGRFSDYKEKLLAIVKDEGLEADVRFIGRVQDVRPVYDISDVVVLPSLSEGFGRAIIEAMAYGTPVIGSKVGGIPEIIEDGIDGLLVPPKNAGAIANAIIRLTQNKEFYSSISKSARIKAQYYNAEDQARRIMHAMQEACET